MTVFHSDRLKDVHPDLVRLVEELGKDHDVVVVCGFRDKESQDAAYQKGNSRLKWPDSKHNQTPYAPAIDIAPTLDGGRTIDWRNFDLFKKQIEDVKYTAKKLGIKVMAGGDWTHFKDFPHFELV